MLAIGQYNTLRILRSTSVGLFLGNAEGDEVLLPNKYVELSMEEGAEITVFVYTDSEDRPVATTETPLGIVNQFAFLRVKEVNQVGAFMDWGLEKDLMVPFRNQSADMLEGRYYLVYVYLDNKTQRVAATAKVNTYIDLDPSVLQVGEEVDILVTHRTEIGEQCMVNNKYRGLIYKNETFKPIKGGHRIKGFVKQVREDGKVDILLQKPGSEAIEPNAQAILDLLKQNQGFLPLSDNSSPEEISQLTQLSKKAFKKAIGHLYKLKLVQLEDTGVRLIHT